MQETGGVLTEETEAGVEFCRRWCGNWRRDRHVLWLHWRWRIVGNRLNGHWVEPSSKSADHRWWRRSSRQERVHFHVIEEVESVRGSLWLLRKVHFTGDGHDLKK